MQQDNELDRTKVFVYGTLRQGFHNHYLFTYAEPTSRFVEERTIHGYSLYGSGIPYMIPTYNQNDTVYGEVYEVSDRTLQILDQLEGHPDWYTRQRVNGNEDIEAYVMLSNQDIASTMNKIPQGVFGGMTRNEVLARGDF